MRKLNAESVTPIKLQQASKACHLLLETEKKTGVRNTPIFLGPPGQGKSAIVEQFVASLNEERQERIQKLVTQGSSVEEAEQQAGPTWRCVSYRLSQCDPTDLKGVPVYTTVNGVEMCSFAPPQVFPINGVPSSANGENVVIFLDELPQANPSMQNLAANIIDGKIGDYTIDQSRSFIVCAGNRKQDHAATYDVPRNVGNRLIKFEVSTTFSEWEEWAAKEKVSPLVIGYLKDKQHFFNEPPPEDGYVYGTPRSWHKISCQLLTQGEKWFDDDSLALFMAQGTVGMASAIAFYQFARAANKDFSVNAIFDGTQAKIPGNDQKDILFSLVLESTYRLNSWIEEAVTHKDYVTTPTSDMVKRANKLVSVLGPEKVAAINNLYKWLDQPTIDKAFQVLVNKYQSDITRTHLRIAMMMDPQLATAGQVFEKINKALISI